MSKYDEAAIAVERQGRRIVVPCLIGDTVYVYKRTLAEGFRTKGISSEIAIGEIVSFRKNKYGVYAKIRFQFNNQTKSYMDSYSISAFGHTVFLTQKEAEAALNKDETK